MQQDINQKSGSACLFDGINRLSLMLNTQLGHLLDGRFLLFRAEYIRRQLGKIGERRQRRMTATTRGRRHNNYGSSTQPFRRKTNFGKNVSQLSPDIPQTRHRQRVAIQACSTI